MPKLDDAELDQRAILIGQEYGGIHPPFEAFYIHSIIYASSRTLDAFQRFEIARSLNDSDVNQVSAVHEALGHAASLSRFFWPSGLGRSSRAWRLLKAARAEKLRIAFGLRDSSPLKDRRLRDSLEHFDERIDRYLLEHDAGVFFPEARIGDIELTDYPTGHTFKLVDPARSYFVCLGQAFFFGDLREEVGQIHQRALVMDANGCRLSGTAPAAGA